MLELRSVAQLERAIAHAKAGRLFVQRTKLYRQYRVTNRETGAQYYVNFFVRNGKRYGACECKGGQQGYACKHLAAAAGLHVMVAAERQKAAAHNPQQQLA